MNQEQVFELRKELKHRDAEVINLRAELRREQDARALLRVEANKATADLDAALAAGEAIAADRDRVITERDQARADLVKAMQAIEAAAAATEVPAGREQGESFPGVTADALLQDFDLHGRRGRGFRRNPPPPPAPADIDSKEQLEQPGPARSRRWTVGRILESPFCCDHPSSPDRHVEGCPTLESCPMCGLGRASDAPSERFAIWLHGRGWLIDVCGGEATVADRLYGATWFSTQDEARAALDAAYLLAAADDQDDVGTVVTL